MTPTRCEEDLYGSATATGSPASGELVSVFKRVTLRYLDRTTLYPRTRWLCLFLLLTLFAIRIYICQGFYIVTYALAIYLLNLLLGFLTPQSDPETEGYVLPVREADEYRPFQRRVDEFKFWMHSTKATILSLLATLFRVLDLPVFWPVLFIYFVLLFLMTMKQQIKHMVKHKYVPFSWGKQTYGDITRERKAPGAKPHSYGKKHPISFPSMQSKSISHLS